MDKKDREDMDRHIVGNDSLLGGGPELPKGDWASDVLKSAEEFSKRIREAAEIISGNLSPHKAAPHFLLHRDGTFEQNFPLTPIPPLLHGPLTLFTKIPDRVKFQPDPMGEQLVDLSQWFDEHNAGRDPEAIAWGRLAKISEEAGEVMEAFIAYTGQNPRKDRGTLGEVTKELLDVAVTALAAFEHLTGHTGQAIPALRSHVQSLSDRMDDLRQEKAEEESPHAH